MDKFNLDKCIKAIAKGDEVALKNLYDNYKNPMFQFALSIVKNYDLAEEAVQGNALQTRYNPLCRTFQRRY